MDPCCAGAGGLPRSSRTYNQSAFRSFHQSHERFISRSRARKAQEEQRAALGEMIKWAQFTQAWAMVYQEGEAPIGERPAGLVVSTPEELDRVIEMSLARPDLVSGDQITRSKHGQ